MDYEQKYAKALWQMKELYNRVQYLSSPEALLVTQTLEITFPELTESEDEKIRKGLITFFQRFPYETLKNAGLSAKDAIAWLEKQGEKSDYNPYKATVESISAMVEKYAPFDSNLQDFYDNVKVKCKDAMEYEKTWLEKQGEQKPADKVEPKFKDGDVFYHKSPLTGIEYIVMSRGVNGCGNIDSYFRYNSEDGFGINVPSVLSGKLDDITPATKEQRDFLFQKMKEAGYEWDSEKKELKKIEQKPAWSEEDELMLQRCIADFEYFLKTDKESFMSRYKEQIDWLRSFKYRVKQQQKQEWSEEDEKMISLLKRIFEVNHPNEHFKVNPIGTTNMEAVSTKEIVDWLKSIKPNHWKPTKEQLEALELKVIGRRDALYELYLDLKEL